MRQAKPSYTQNNDHRSCITVTLHVHQHTEFRRNSVINMSSVQYIIRNTTYVLNFTAVKYPLHKCSEIMQC